MVSDKSQKSTHQVAEAKVTRKFNLLRKYIQSCNGRLHHLKKRLYVVTREVKALKRARESHLKTVKKAERIERKLDAEKTKLKRKMLKAGTASKPRKDSRKGNTSITSI